MFVNPYISFENNLGYIIFHLITELSCRSVMQYHSHIDGNFMSFPLDLTSVLKAFSSCNIYAMNWMYCCVVWYVHIIAEPPRFVNTFLYIFPNKLFTNYSLTFKLLIVYIFNNYQTIHFITLMQIFSCIPWVSCDTLL